MSDKSKRAMAYIRVSTVRQVAEGNSIRTQTLSVMEYAKSKGLILRIRDIIIDDGTSGGIPIWDRVPLVDVYVNKGTLHDIYV